MFNRDFVLNNYKRFLTVTYMEYKQILKDMNKRILQTLKKCTNFKCN